MFACTARGSADAAVPLQFLRIVRLVRLTKLLRIVRVARIFQRFEDTANIRSGCGTLRAPLASRKSLC